MPTSDIEKFLNVVYSPEEQINETQVSGDSLTLNLLDLGLDTSVTFQKTNFSIDEEKSILDALQSPKASGLVKTLIDTPITSLSPGKKTIHKIFTDLYTSVGIWNPETNSFYPDNLLDPNDLKIKNKIDDSTLLQSIIYLAEIGEVDERFKGWWRKFLNKWAAKLDVVKEFSIKEADLSQKGLYLWIFGDKIEYVGIASNSYKTTFQDEYGKVEKYKCTINGQVTRCKLNFMVQGALNEGKTVNYFICPIPPSEIKQMYNKNKDIFDNYLSEGTKEFDKKFLEIIESCLIYKFNTLKPNGINANYPNGKVRKDLNDKGTLTPLQNMEEINRLQELAGIPKQYQILYRIDSALEKLGIEDGDEIESGSEEWVELLSIIYQVPFEGDIEVFSQQIDAKAKKLNFPVYKLENNLDIRDIEII